MILFNELKSALKYLFGFISILLAAFIYGKKQERSKQDKEALDAIISAKKISAKNSKLTRRQLIDEL